MALHKVRRNYLACFRCRHLDQSGKHDGTPDESGAVIHYKSDERLGLKYALTAKWNPEKPEKGKIPCVLGACYSFRREWYDTVGRPLSILRAWGGDEEILSLATWIMGGTVYLMPQAAGHIHAAANKGRIKTADESQAIWGNRYAVVDSMPFPDLVKADLRSHLSASNRIDRSIPRTNDDVRKLAAVLRTGPCGLDWLVEGGIIKGYAEPDRKAYTPPPAPDDDRAQIIVRRREVCSRCDAVNSFVQVSGMRNTAAFGMGYARCKRCGHKGQLRVLRE